MDKITLDRETFKALASDTRLDILKALDERQKTVTELAKQLDLDKSTVFEHLEKLAAVDLIQKIEDGTERKWVYWQLSWTGRRLLHPETITLALLLSTASASLVTALVAAWLWLRSNVAQVASDADKAAAGGAAGPSTRSLAAPAAAPVDTTPGVQHDPLLLGAMIALALVFVALVAYAAFVKARAKRATTP